MTQVRETEREREREYAGETEREREYSGNYNHTLYIQRAYQRYLYKSSWD